MNALVHYRRKGLREQGYMNLLVRTATHLKTVVLRTPVNEWLDPMKEAPSNEGAFLVSETPSSGRHRGPGTGDGGGVVTGPAPVLLGPGG